MFLKAPFLVLHFPHYTSMSLQMMSVIFLSVFMILLSTLSLIRNLMWQQLELVSELESDLKDTLDWGRKRLVHFNAGKAQFVFVWPVKIIGLSLSCKLDWGSCIVFIAKTASRKIGTVIHFVKFLSPEVALCLCKSTIRPYMEYSCHARTGAPSC